MLTYEVQYRCYISNLYPNLPFIRYRYRRSGKLFWEKKEQVFFDWFASEYWKTEYYDENVNRISAYNRVRIMRRILDNKYGGSLKNYVRAMVEYEIMSDLIDKEEDYATQEICLSFITDGWERTSVRLKRKECENEKLD